VTVAEGNILNNLYFETSISLTIMRSLLPSSDNKSKEFLDIVHSDVCAPMTTTALSR
jgi:hypothetical protein